MNRTSSGPRLVRLHGRGLQSRTIQLSLAAAPPFVPLREAGLCRFTHRKTRPSFASLFFLCGIRFIQVARWTTVKRIRTETPSHGEYASVWFGADVFVSVLSVAP